MQRAKIRRYVLVIVVLLAAASMFPSLGSSSHRFAPPARHTTLLAKHRGVSVAGAPGHVTPIRKDP